eukprot:scaffold233441_cov14-Tisochrysis_lutea.AAC.1
MTNAGHHYSMFNQTFIRNHGMSPSQRFNPQVGCQSCHLLPPDLATTTGGVPKGGKKGNGKL